jgi:predicted MFS family arabinose efflux permease
MSARAALPEPPAGAPAPDPAERRRAYALGLLLVVYVFNFVDRSILAILLEPIKQEFRPSDTALGVLSGIAFAVIYSTLGIPIARWADRGSRKTIISLSLFVWSAMTALCGLVTSFWQLVAARIGVGVGEAGCSPPAHSLISDYFPPERRATAFGIYSLGIPIGGSFGVLAGGWINQWFDWRTAFLVVGLPGVALAVISQLTLREPERRGATHEAGSAPLPVRTVARQLWARRSFRHLALAGALHSLVGYGVGTWNAAFLMRTHGMGTGEVGTWLAGIGLLAGGLGTYLGGALADRLRPRDERWSLWLPGAAILLALPFGAGFYLWPGKLGALACAVPAALLGATYLGPTFATTQALAEPRMRAVASAVLLLVLNLIGMGLGPLAVGVVSDRLARAGFGGESLRYALLLVVLVNVWSAAHYALGARTLRADLRLH